MKKNILFLLVAILFSVNSNAQSYSYGACFVNPNFIKLEGKILISDSTVLISTINKGAEKTNNYSVVKKVNGLIYITDGVVTHSIAILPESGKKKGFEYDNIITFYFDKSLQGLNMMYYSKLIN
jgi:hypothetical protein